MARIAPRMQLTVFLCIVSCIQWSSQAHAEPAEGDTTSSFTDKLEEGFYSRLAVFTFGIAQQPVKSLVNPNNTLGIPRYQGETDLRPDFSLDYDPFEVSLKPRFQVYWEKWEDGVRAGTDHLTDKAFLNEGFLRYRLNDNLSTSYGRENLQWGPSILLSPSNPFNSVNGRSNPSVEVPGLDYGRVVWTPNGTWTASAIANTDAGHLQTQGPFRRAYAAKIDYTGNGKYFSVIPSVREETGATVGYFGGWNVSDALLLYSEGSILGRQTLSEKHTNSFLGGGGYTFSSGPTLNLEYLRQNGGCLRRPFAACFSEQVEQNKTTNLQLVGNLSRKNYVLFQFTDDKIVEELNLQIQAIHNIDDHSNRVTGIVEYEIGRRTQAYLVVNGFTGSRNTEFGSLLRYSAFVGLSYTY